MKKVFAFLVMVGLSTVSQAVYVKWSLENSNYNVENWTANYGETVYLVQAGQDATAAEIAAAAKTPVSEGGGRVDGAVGAGKDGGIHQFTITDVTLTDGAYYYLVIFKGGVTTSDQYAVSNAVQYTGTPQTDNANGIYGADAAGTPPDVGDFYMPGWMGGSWTAPQTAPEPTVLALLALGAAGLALRRRAA